MFLWNSLYFIYHHLKYQWCYYVIKRCDESSSTSPFFFVLETLLHYWNSAVNNDVTFCRCASHLKESGHLSTCRETDLRADSCRLHSPEEDWGLFKKEGQQSWAAGSMQPVLHPHPSWFWVQNCGCTVYNTQTLLKMFLLKQLMSVSMYFFQVKNSTNHSHRGWAEGKDCTARGQESFINWVIVLLHSTLKLWSLLEYYVFI